MHIIPVEELGCFWKELCSVSSRNVHTNDPGSKHDEPGTALMARIYHLESIVRKCGQALKSSVTVREGYRALQGKQASERRAIRTGMVRKISTKQP